MQEQYHFIGIGGIGMSALATILLQRGIRVTGSDAASSQVTDRLQKQGAEIFIGHAAAHLGNPSAVIYSTAVRETNPEVQQARHNGVPFLHRSGLLHRLMQGYSPLLVTGTHGKTTTSSLLAHLLMDAGYDPSWAVGGMISGLESNGGHGKGPWFVAEADESDGSFLSYQPFGAIVTNIDNDHLDYWKTLDHMIVGFDGFLHQVQSSGHLLWCGDDEILRSLKPKGFSYGFGAKNALRIENFRQDGWNNIFDLSFEGVEYPEIAIPLVGAHNVLNAAAVFGMGLGIDISEEKIRKAFGSFRGISRRAEWKGEQGEIDVFDDYAHHPTEIFATLRAIKQAIGIRRLVVAFQSHRYTRTRDCLHEFGPAFERADLLVLTDIYSAGESPIPEITGSVLLSSIRNSTVLDVRFAPLEKLPEFLVHLLQPQDVLLTMGAGDITLVGPEVLRMLK